MGHQPREGGSVGYMSPRGNHLFPPLYSGGSKSCTHPDGISVEPMKGPHHRSYRSGVSAGPHGWGLPGAARRPPLPYALFVVAYLLHFPTGLAPISRGTWGAGAYRRGGGASQWTPIGRPLDAHWTPIGRPLETYFLQQKSEVTFTRDSEPVLLTRGS